MMFLSRILLVAIPILGLPADQPAEEPDTDSGAPSYSGPPSQHTKPWPAPSNNGYMGPPSQYTRPWPAPQNSWNGPRGYNVPSWRPAPRAAPSFNMAPSFSQPEPRQGGIEVIGGSEGMPLPPVQSGVPFAELQPSSYAQPSFQPARYPSNCGMPFRSLCGNSGYNPGYGNGNSGYNPGVNTLPAMSSGCGMSGGGCSGAGNSGYNPGFGNGNFGFNPGYGNGNSGYNPGYGNGNAELLPVTDSNSGFNPGTDSDNSEEGNTGEQNGNSGFNPGYGNGNSYTRLPGRGSCYNVCGNNYRCGGYSNGYGYGGCRPICRSRCSIQPSCPPTQQWNVGNNGNSFSCGSGSGGWGYNPGYGGYNPVINRPAQNGYMGVNTLPAMSSGCGMSGGGCSDRAAGPQVVASAPKTPIVFDDTPAGDEEQQDSN